MAMKAEQENMANTPKNGRAHVGIAPVCLFGVAPCWASDILASYLRAAATATVVHGLAGAAGAGVGAGALMFCGAQGFNLQHCFSPHLRPAQTSAGFTGSEPAGQAKLAQVGGGGVVVAVVPGVVVTVEQGAFGVVVTVVTTTVVPGIVVTVEQGAFGVVVTVVPGVVVTVEHGALGVVV